MPIIKKVAPKVDTVNNTVTLTRETKASDDQNVMLSLTFDFTDVSRESELKYMVEDRLIAWRTSGVRKLDSDQLYKKYNGQTIMVKDAFPRITVALTEEEQKIRAIILKASQTGKSLEEIEGLIMDEGESTD